VWQLHGGTVRLCGHHEVESHVQQRGAQVPADAAQHPSTRLVVPARCGRAVPELSLTAELSHVLARERADELGMHGCFLYEAAPSAQR
jgi:hypothetical protein